MGTFSVDDKVALVTGANRGIGREIVRALIGAGVSKVYGAVRKRETLAPLVEEYGGDVLVPVEFDLADHHAAQRVSEIAGDTELLVCNAGVIAMASVFSDNVFESLDFELERNLYGFIRLVRAFAPVLERNGGGAIVQINSAVSMKCFDPGFATYCASKAAAYSITQAVRMQLSGHGTSVFSVHPGPIATDMAAHAGIADMAEPPSLVERRGVF